MSGNKARIDDLRKLLIGLTPFPCLHRRPIHPWDGECTLNATSKTGKLDQPYASIVTGTNCAGGIAARTDYVAKVRVCVWSE